MDNKMLKQILTNKYLGANVKMSGGGGFPFPS